MVTRICKECNKLFVPKGREIYCSDTHYRPCPTCGEPVVAKYLSDPPRRCNACKQSKNVSKAKNLVKLFDISSEDTLSESVSCVEQLSIEQPPVEPAAEQDKILNINISESDDVRTYVGPSMLKGFIRGHRYLVMITKDSYTYEVSSNYDVTERQAVDCLINLSSKISIDQHFALS